MGLQFWVCMVSLSGLSGLPCGDASGINRSGPEIFDDRGTNQKKPFKPQNRPFLIPDRHERLTSRLAARMLTSCHLGEKER